MLFGLLCDECGGLLVGGSGNQRRSIHDRNRHVSCASVARHAAIPIPPEQQMWREQYRQFLDGKGPRPQYPRSEYFG